MTPVIFINCSEYPFIEQIISGKKWYETRNSDTLGRFAGQRVLLAETGKHGVPIVKASAMIYSCLTVNTKWAWECFYRNLACIPAGSKYDWQPDTKRKVCYYLDDVKRVSPFVPEGKRHGRIWMEHEDEWRYVR